MKKSLRKLLWIACMGFPVSAIFGNSMNLCEEGCEPCYSDCSYSDCYNDCCYNDCSRALFAFDVSALYWRAYGDGLELGCGPVIIEERHEDSTDFSDLKSRSRDLRHNWDVGYRVGAGYFSNQGQCGWFIEGDYTYFYTDNRRRRDNRDDEHDTKLCKDNDDERNHHDRRKRRLFYHEADARIGYTFDVNGCGCQGIQVLPFVGVKYASIHHRIKRHSRLLIIHEDGSNDHGHIKIRARDRFEGVGPQLGIGLAKISDCGLGGFASFDVADLYGRSRVRTHRDQKLTHEVSEENEHHMVDSDRVRRHLWRSQFVFDFAIGIDWEFSAGCMTIIPAVAWETHRYFHQTHICDHGDLTFSGFTFSLTTVF